jgi:hypothetical protein
LVAKVSLAMASLTSPVSTSIASLVLAGNGCPVFNRWTTNGTSSEIAPLMATRIVLTHIVDSADLSAGVDAESAAAPDEAMGEGGTGIGGGNEARVASGAGGAPLAPRWGPYETCGAGGGEDLARSGGGGSDDTRGGGGGTEPRGGSGGGVEPRATSACGIEPPATSGCAEEMRGATGSADTPGRGGCDETGCAGGCDALLGAEDALGDRARAFGARVRTEPCFLSLDCRSTVWAAGEAAGLVESALLIDATNFIESHSDAPCG